MKADFPPTHLTALKTHLRRRPWCDFPPVVLHAEESAVKKHPCYAAAKSGDAGAAEKLMLELLPLAASNRICEIIGERSPSLLAVHAQERDGANVIPSVMVKILPQLLNLPLAKEVIQINRVSHTGSDGYHRLAWPRCSTAL